MATLNDVAAAFAELEPMQLQLAHYRDKVPVLAAQAKEAYEGAFKTGAIDANKMVNEQQRFGKLKIEHLNLRYQYNRLRAKIELYAGRSLEQLAEIEKQMEAEAERKAALPHHAEPPADILEHSRPEDATPKNVTPKTKPAAPGAKKPQVDSRVARATRTGSKAAGGKMVDANVAPASGVAPKTIAQKSASFSPLEPVKKLLKRENSPEDLPYGEVKPAAKR
jgi:hypothetical protein